MQANQFAVNPSIISWARRRSGRPQVYLDRHFPDIEAWEVDGVNLSYDELADLADRLRTPLGNFYLDSPPVIELGLPDFRTMGDASLTEPSIDLIETVAICTQRQEWYRNFAISNGLPPVDIVGSLELETDVKAAAASLRRDLQFEVENRRQFPNLDEVYRALVLRTESLGVLVMKNGVVGNNTHRPLDPKEFRGFAMVDDFAPLVFVNGRDATAASIFTLIHELVHIARGQSALTNQPTPEFGIPQPSTPSIERWCNRVAAEVLVPSDELRWSFQAQEHLSHEVYRLSRVYRASKYVVLQSLWDAGLIDWNKFSAERAELRDAWGNSERTDGSSGGEFYNTEATRVGRRFGRALVADTLAGNTLFAEAYRLLTTPKHETFLNFAAHLGVR